MVESTCEWCGEEYKHPPSKNERFCSMECYSAWRQEDGNSPHIKRVKLVCGWCEEEFEERPCREDQRTFCSMECFEEWKSVRYEGEGNPNWRGGITGRKGYGANWEEVRKEVRGSRELVCEACDTSEEELPRELHTHHIKPRSEFEEVEEANAPENLVLLCLQCHPKVEHGKIEVAR